MDIIGVAPNAFSRVVPAKFLDNYTIICLKKRRETEYAKKDAKVIVCEEDFSEDSKLVKQSTMAILKIPGVISYINKLQDPHILIYKPMPELEKYCDLMGWKLIANRFELRDKLENKKNFREMLIASGATAITGSTYKASDFTIDFYEKLVTEFGNKLVFQIAEMKNGGGLGTFFINSKVDYLNFLNRLKELMLKDTEISYINVTKFIEGIPASIISVATQKGTITGTLQAQIQDIDLVNDPTKGSGLYCGHDYGFFNGNDEILLKAKNIAKKFGDFISKEIGYRGLFGMDLLVNLEKSEVYPVECNPRYTDLFPIISMNCIANRLTPYDYYHINAFTNFDTAFDPQKISEEYKYLLPASQLVLSTKINSKTLVNGDLKAGVYKFDTSGNISYVRSGYRFEDLIENNEFLITEGVPEKGQILTAYARIARVVFKVGILESKNKLRSIYEKIIENVYKLVDLSTV